MATLHQYDYLMAFGTIFALLDAFNIGANDCANSFATSVSSHSLSYRQAIGCAVLFEFLGAVLAVRCVSLRLLCLLAPRKLSLTLALLLTANREVG